MTALNPPLFTNNDGGALFRIGVPCRAWTMVSETGDDVATERGRGHICFLCSKYTADPVPRGINDQVETLISWTHVAARALAAGYDLHRPAREAHSGGLSCLSAPMHLRTGPISGASVHGESTQDSEVFWTHGRGSLPWQGETESCTPYFATRGGSAPPAWSQRQWWLSTQMRCALSTASRSKTFSARNIIVHNPQQIWRPDLVHDTLQDRSTYRHHCQSPSAGKSLLFATMNGHVHTDWLYKGKEPCGGSLADR